MFYGWGGLRFTTCKVKPIQLAQISMEISSRKELSGKQSKLFEECDTSRSDFYPVIYGISKIIPFERFRSHSPMV